MAVETDSSGNISMPTREGSLQSGNIFLHPHLADLRRTPFTESSHDLKIRERRVTSRMRESKNSADRRICKRPDSTS
ncbi:hypothetical protein BDV23DRAFT_156722 [Aspergillus alliaceus]|uniref:Uncharacterized protein n=1 Tax=Petromyces alliaceus TaxID=209559 RepID=A0A5N7C7Z1_PETAA|nr:uncharacterized protein BDW43DRAFT_262194 [Aspergillus alliaceus]KAB8238623.1 hypothetical protein BDW43DRAFT_262194 [Aspergillus alliaceus]KAE8389703.1 hypothetical protein BDV23DRAFT_156722 [Aspergillus alliaceus]